MSCDTTTGTPTCSSNTTCTYACNTGLTDCNASIAPDTDGCECATPICCGTSCETTHSNGEGQSFFDCNPLFTYDQAQATSACAAFTGSSLECSGALGCTGAGKDQVVCTVGFASCVCWDFAGASVGLVATSGSTTCRCPGAGSNTWD